MPDASQPPAANESLGQLLTRLRTERALAQKLVANQAGIDGSTLSRLEKGERGVSRDVLERICQVLNLDRRERLAVLVAAGFLTDEAARLLADEDVSRLAHLLTSPTTQPEDVSVLRQFLSLALTYADARGYDVD
jgi:transcriptional regulator with XRE-family HTH domain